MIEFVGTLVVTIVFLFMFYSFSEKIVDYYTEYCADCILDSKAKTVYIRRFDMLRMFFGALAIAYIGASTEAWYWFFGIACISFVGFDMWFQKRSKGTRYYMQVFIYSTLLYATAGLLAVAHRIWS